MWLLTHVPAGAQGTLADALGTLFAPLLDPIGIRHEMAVALILGFVAKEILLGALAVVYGVSDAGLASAILHQVDPISGISFLIFALVYVPCLSTVAAIRRESGSRAFAALSVAWSISLAWLLSFAFYQGARYWF